MHQLQPISRDSLSVESELRAFAGRFSEAAEMVESNPALALCLAHLPGWDTAFGKGDPDAITRRLLHGKRRSACEFLGFPGTEAVVKLLARIPMFVCYLPHLLRLRRVLREQPSLIKMLVHLPVFNAETLFLAAYWRWGDSVTISFFCQIAAECRGKDLPTQVWPLDDIAKLAQRLGKTVRRRFGSAREIRRFHDRMAEEFNAVNLSAPEKSEWFPPPPRAGTAQIVPLDQPGLLAEEGRSQHHCAAIYRSAVEEGNLYFYRVLKPERATLCVAKTGSGWAIQELKAACNAEVANATQKAVEAWLTGVEKSPDSNQPSLF
jgi:PcfJ-like protein